MKRRWQVVLLVVFCGFAGLTGGGFTRALPAVPLEVAQLFPYTAHLWQLTGTKELPSLYGSTGMTIGNISLVEAPGFPMRLKIGQPVHLEVTDLNNDGVFDLVLTTFEIFAEADPPWTKLWVLIGERPTEFCEPLLLHEVGWYGGPALTVKTGDLDHDGYVDLVLGDLAGVGVWICFGDGTGGVREKVFFEVPSLYQPVDLALADLDEDGRTDLLVVGLRAVHVLWGSPDSGFLSVIAADVHADGDAVRLVTGDFDGDGRMDFAVLGVTATITAVEYWADVFLNVGERQFTRICRTTIAESAEGVGFVLAAGDLNRDGHLDLVTTSNGFVLVLVGSGSGCFEVDRFFYVFDPFVSMIALHDLSGNGCPNLIVLGTTINRVLISQQCYTTSGPPRMISGAAFFYPAPRTCAVTDVDVDGTPDLIIAGSEWANGASWTILSVLVGRRRG